MYNNNKYDYVYVYIYILHIYIYICVGIYIYIHIHTYIHTYIHAYACIIHMLYNSTPSGCAAAARDERGLAKIAAELYDINVDIYM